ncbi:MULTISPECIES: non-homologous end-joining DNA ligase [Agrobacterium]|uniref:non-homologous end-joining DNA ligase n=1 Tax=Agrobacterium tumefaciens TaxID=358 RepID=UPI001573A0EE|nr:non-homologous end-joining DNA ligase [Agrobacterium tumefaciens]WCK22433.1 non-homologous end-joining DNA ligase [Agrobacterium tumefaciens]
MTKPPRSKPLLRDAEAPIRSKPRRRRDPAQPNLLLDPMPIRVEPCLALLKSKPPEGDDWAYEIKWDGYRLAIHIEPTGIRILTKGGHDWTSRFPEIEKGARDLGVASAIIDGEAVMYDEQGRSDFNLLKGSLGGRAGKKTSPAQFVAFDLLYLDGHDFQKTELRVRRHLLQDLIGNSEGSSIKFSEAFDTDGATLFQASCDHGLEGIIAKHLDSPYRSGRLGDWIKIKCIQSESFFIVGYEQSAGAFKSLLLGAYRGDQVVYVGSVGTGFKGQQAAELRSMMDKLPWRKKAPPVLYSGTRSVTWLQPTLIAEIEYRGWTSDEKLRHSSFKGLREIQDNAEVYTIEAS